jgi:transposase
MQMRDELGTFYKDEDFAHLYPRRGQSAAAPWRLALITILQFVENLSDRQAAEAVRARIDWKYALSMELTDTGFDYSVLSEFRHRLLAGKSEHYLLDAMVRCFTERKLIKDRGKQRTDSTHVLAVVRDLTRVEHIGETLRHALNELAIVAPEWLVQHVPQTWYDRYGKRFEESRLPRLIAERETLTTAIGTDGFQLLDRIYQPDTPSLVQLSTAVELLRQVWLQQFYAPNEKVQLREAKDSPPGALRIRSVYDMEARHSIKRSTEWTGYKVHLTETCDSESPRLITNTETTEATTQDQSVVKNIHKALKRKGMLPKQHIVDQGYMSAHLIATSQQEYEVELLGPVAMDVRWQAKAGEGFSLSDFQVNWKRKTVRCPRGKRSHLWKPGQDSFGNPIIHVEFRKPDCAKCPVRSQCTRSVTQPRGITLKAQEDYEALRMARTRQQTDSFKQEYAIRSGVEGSLSQGIRAFHLRSCRYIGLAKARLQHIMTAAALNVVRAVAWLEGIPLAKTRQSHFARLNPSLPDLQSEPVTTPA